jgi:hypothetical protein
VPESGNIPEVAIAGYLAEFDFIREGMRQDQRERHGFLAFALAGSGLILGLLMRSSPARTAGQTCFLVCLAAIVTIVAQILTIRASQGVASAGAYLRFFVEPHVPGLYYQRRNAIYITRSRWTSASLGFGVAYVALSLAFGIAWFAAPLQAHSTRQVWQSGIVAVVGVLSLLFAAKLMRASFTGWTSVNDAWEAIHTDEQQKAEFG